MSSGADPRTAAIGPSSARNTSATAISDGRAREAVPTLGPALAHDQPGAAQLGEDALEELHRDPLEPRELLRGHQVVRATGQLGQRPRAVVDPRRDLHGLIQPPEGPRASREQPSGTATMRARGCGGIGRRAGFRFLCPRTCGFESRHPHASGDDPSVRREGGDDLASLAEGSAAGFFLRRTRNRPIGGGQLSPGHARTPDRPYGSHGQPHTGDLVCVPRPSRHQPAAYGRFRVRCRTIPPPAGRLSQLSRPAARRAPGPAPGRPGRGG